jgi:uncharacterized Zn finger protein
VFDYGWRPYVSVGERRRRAEKEMARLKKKGQTFSPVVIQGRTITRTFWGKAWCENLERYSDFSNRLPRGRTYVRNGSVLDLRIDPGRVQALVSGTEIYRVEVGVSAVPKRRWSAICSDCAGAIDTLVELLQGRFSKGVMERICRQATGLFPAPAEIKLSCSCPDWATMCKHVAAVLYGIGARLDEQPELLFRLRGVEERDLVAKAGRGLALVKEGPSEDRVLASEGLSELFGLELNDSPQPAAAQRARRKAKTEPGPKAKPKGTAGGEPAPRSKGGGGKAGAAKRAKRGPADKRAKGRPASP